MAVFPRRFQFVTSRWRFDTYSYLYNTDGILVSHAGFPVVLLNEHINGWQNINRPHYHTSSDTTKYMSVDYGTSHPTLLVGF